MLFLGKNNHKCPEGAPKMVIYCIENLRNGKKYIGQTFSCLQVRYGSGSKTFHWWKYVTNKYLKNSIKKYGHENFSIKILESNLPNQEALDEKEKFYIEKFNTIQPNGYNYVSGGQEFRKNFFTVEQRDHQASVKTNGRISKVLDNYSGSVLEIKNINRFAKDNKLDGSCITRVILGELLSFNGLSKIENPMKRILMSHKNGEKYEVLFFDISSFCRKYSITRGNVNSVIEGKWKTNKGWSTYTLNENEYFKNQVYKPEHKVTTFKL